MRQEIVLPTFMIIVSGHQHTEERSEEPPMQIKMYEVLTLQ